MKKYTKELASDILLPNITVSRLYCDGEHYGYEARADKGYLMCNPTANEVRFDENGDQYPFIYYCYVAGFPKNYDFAKFPYEAVQI